MPLLDTKTIEAKEPLPGWPGRFFNSETMTFGYYNTEEGADLHEHSHPNEEIWHVIEGELEVTIGCEVHIAGPGMVAMVPPDTLHSVKVLSAGRVIVVDHPRRESIGGVKTS
ncbi:MAG: cupin domain-containing protein [Pseudomonadales bacterium]